MYNSHCVSVKHNTTNTIKHKKANLWSLFLNHSRHLESQNTVPVKGLLLLLFCRQCTDCILFMLGRLLFSNSLVLVGRRESALDLGAQVCHPRASSGRPSEASAAC